MKTITITLIILTQFAYGSDRYTENMKKNITAVYKAGTMEELQQAINALERIGEAEKTKWEPYYYVSFGYVMMATRETEPAAKDKRLDQALVAWKHAADIVPNESEVAALEGFIYMMQLTVDPASRGQQYSAMAYGAFGKAVKLNPDNPRALYLLAQMQYGTAQHFGKPVQEACDTLRKALEKFDTFKPGNELAPAWGKQQAETMKEGCEF